MNTTTFSNRRVGLWLAMISWLTVTTAQLWAVPPTSATSPANPQAEASELLAIARQAMNQGNLASAEAYIARAESISPKFPTLYQGDTPTKLRAELNQKRGSTPTAMPAGGVQQAGGAVLNQGFVMPTLYNSGNDQSQVQPAGNTTPMPGGLLLPTAGNPATASNALAMPPLPNAPLPSGPSSTPNLQRSESLPPGVPSAATPQLGPTQNIPAQATTPATSKAQELLNAGEQALQAGQMDQALKSFREAYAIQGELSDNARTRLQDHLRLLSRPTQPGAPATTPLQGAENNQQIMAKQISAEVNRVQSQARELMTKDPKKSLEMLEKAKATYQNASLDPAMKDIIQRRLDLTMADVQKFLKANAAQIELDQQNNAVRADVAKTAQNRQELDDKLGKLVTDFNKLVDEQRFAEAEVVAKRASTIAPDSVVTQQLLHTAKMIRRMDMERQIRAGKENGTYGALTDVDLAATPHSGPDYMFGKDWKALSGSRLDRQRNEMSSQRTPREREIEQKTGTLIKLSTRTDPQKPGGKKSLREILDYLETVANINIHIDEAGLASEAVDSSVMVELHITNEIPLKSVLNLILPQHNLAYVIKNDVLMITSKERTKGLVYPKSYSVADLVIPIPNFVPNGSMGLPGALMQGYEATRMGRGGNTGYIPTLAAAPINVAATGDGGQTSAQMLPQLAQQQALNNAAFARQGNNGPPATGIAQPMGFGPGGMGGGAQADFDSLIELITSTVEPTTWKANGGQGDVAPFETNLTLVVSNTQEVHERLADLLQQLRRLQDLQVTIEVRFITLTDNFFERIGVDFDFAIDDNASSVNVNSDSGNSAVVGLQPTSTGPSGPAFTPGFNIQFNQGGFTEGTVPSFPGIGFNPGSAGTFGFAILSDIEAYFLIQAAQGDSRNNILQAPKVTLFNGQSAFISDTSQRPFVTSIIPVVGDFAAAQQPVIVVLSEGTSLTVQAVVSNDRRFVRLTVVPFFSQIGDVEEFTFSGSKTSTTKESDSSSKGTEDAKAKAKDTTTVSEGTTVQLPTFAFVTVTTTVSVPDGGTVLLGGIKRLSEGRNERGIPILSKIPYINRLFKNVGIGRSTQSLMMMVTPRIIIQEEEEEKLIGAATPN